MRLISAIVQEMHYAIGRETPREGEGGRAKYSTEWRFRLISPLLVCTPAIRNWWSRHAVTTNFFFRIRFLPSPKCTHIECRRSPKFTQQFWFSVYFYYYWYHSIRQGQPQQCAQHACREWARRQTIEAVQCTRNQWVWQQWESSQDRIAINVSSRVHIQSWLILCDMHCRKSLQSV